jgi:L-ascorbate metabolism protein UlaG (beta-lactamase superfamily)
MGVELSWLGVSTFRLQVDDTVIFLDTFVDRPPNMPQVGVASKDVERADLILVGHSHYDHLLGADNIAANTGAQVFGSYETVRILADYGTSRDQLRPLSGAEVIALGDIRIRVFPSLHACGWAKQPSTLDECLIGEENLALQDQLELRRKVQLTKATDAYHEIRDVDPSRGDGGALAYLIETRHGSIWWNDSAGYWSQLIHHLDPDVAILAAAGRGNVNGQPTQGSTQQYLVRQAELLRPQRVVFCHHDNWNPPRTHIWDMEPVRKEIADRSGQSSMIGDLAYNDPVHLFS